MKLNIPPITDDEMEKIFMNGHDYSLELSGIPAKLKLNYEKTMKKAKGEVIGILIKQGESIMLCIGEERTEYVECMRDIRTAIKTKPEQA